MGILGDSTALEKARQRLEAAGFDADRCDVLQGEDEAAKERAADALRGSPAEFVHYSAENYVEDLDR